MAKGATATGGTVTNYTVSGTNYNAHIFTNSGTFIVSGGSLNCEVLVVAGGGGGGEFNGSGGGAGGLIYTNNYNVYGSNSVIVGDGGVVGDNGNNSGFGLLLTVGGGRGINYNSGAAFAGGSGGGGSSDPIGTAGGSGTIGQGYAGGSGLSRSFNYIPLGGGGGAGSVGSDGTLSGSGNGGAGLYYAQFEGLGGTPAGWFAAGGGGSWSFVAGTSGIGGNGGGGSGGVFNTSIATAGVSGTGGGGGGGNFINLPAGDPHGGSGIVIVRYVPTSFNIKGKNLSAINSKTKVIPSNFIANLVMHYKMNDNAASRIVVDSYGTNTGRSVQNTDILSSPGKIGTAFSFNYGDLIDAGNMTNFIGNIFTFAAWVKPTTQPDRTVFGGEKSQIPQLYINSTDRLVFRRNGFSPIVTSTIVITNLVWSHVAVSYATNGAYALYINSVNSGSGTTSQTFAQADTWVGATYGTGPPGAYFKGSIDDVRIYNRVLTTNEINQIYNGGLGTEQE